MSGPNEVQHVWFIECKQREGEKTWCFFPPAANVLDLSRNAFLIETLMARDDLNPGKLRGLLNPILPELPVVGEGVEAYKNSEGNWNTNPQAVTNATRQAIMPIGHHIPYVLQRNFVLDYKGQQLALYLPIIVTTAKLYRLKENRDWKDLSSFDEIEECFVREPALLSSFTTPTYVSRYWTETIRSYMVRIEQRYPDVFNKGYLGSLGRSRADLIDYIPNVATRSIPTRVVIAELEALSGILSTYLAKVDDLVDKALRT